MYYSILMSSFVLTYTWFPDYSLSEGQSYDKTFEHEELPSFWSSSDFPVIRVAAQRNNANERVTSLYKSPFNDFVFHTVNESLSGLFEKGEYMLIFFILNWNVPKLTKRPNSICSPFVWCCYGSKYYKYNTIHTIIKTTSIVNHCSRDVITWISLHV